MARLPRLCPVGMPQHIIQRSNNRQVYFASEDGFTAYVNWNDFWSVPEFTEFINFHLAPIFR